MAGYDFAEIEKKFALMDVPEPSYLRDVFINYGKADSELQKIIRLSVAPLSNYLAILKIAGATFYLIPFHKFLWQVRLNINGLRKSVAMRCQPHR